jgi:2-polyprenyl-3-methyl-5-hydroxy-6-metoxy-1,4-benzoquinol methylase
MKSEKMWDRMAGKWDTPGVSLGEHDIVLLNKSEKYLSDRSAILDYGCATGSIVFELADKAREVYGLDISSNMIEIAKIKAAEQGVTNTHFIHGSIFNETLVPESYDLILAFSVLHLVEEIPLVFRRINQLLKPGGLFISASPCLGKSSFRNAFISVPLFLASSVGILPHINFFTESKLENYLHEENFQILESNGSPDGSILEQFIVARKG